MNWLGSFFRRPPQLDADRAAALDAYCSLREAGVQAPLCAQRMVVVDVESSGLNPRRDRLISVGAVAVRDGLVHLADSFQVVLRQDRASDDQNIVVHGIGGTAQLSGCDPAAGLVDFLAFAGKAPLVAFTADFDRILIERASAAVLGLKPDNRWFDLALLAPAIYPGGAENRDGPRRSNTGTVPGTVPAFRTLDEWLQRFGIENYARHDALADALATAQLLLVVLAEAQRQGESTLAELVKLQRAQLWLERASRA